MENKYKNPHSYIMEDYGDGTTLITNHADTISIIVDNDNIQRVLNNIWQVSRTGYYTLSRQGKKHLQHILMESDESVEVLFKNNNPYTDYTRSNLFINSIDDTKICLIEVDGLEVIVDKSVYYDKDLYKYKYTMYQGYVITLVKRRRVFLHKLVLGMDDSTHIRFRFRNKNRLDCRLDNLYAEQLL